MFTIITKLVTLSGLKVNGSCLLVSLYLQLRPGLVKSKNALAVFSLFTLQWSLFPVTRCKGCCYDKARLCCCQRTKCFSQKLSLCFFYNHKHSGFYITVFNKLQQIKLWQLQCTCFVWLNWHSRVSVLNWDVLQLSWQKLSEMGQLLLCMDA